MDDSASLRVEVVRADDDSRWLSHATTEELEEIRRIRGAVAHRMSAVGLV
jgi:hypothetical protein